MLVHTRLNRRNIHRAANGEATSNKRDEKIPNCPMASLVEWLNDTKTQRVDIVCVGENSSLGGSKIQRGENRIQMAVIHIEHLFLIAKRIKTVG